MSDFVLRRLNPKWRWWTFWRSKWIGYIRRARIKQAYEEWE